MIGSHSVAVLCTCSDVLTCCEVKKIQKQRTLQGKNPYSYLFEREWYGRNSPDHCSRLGIPGFRREVTTFKRIQGTKKLSPRVIPRREFIEEESLEENSQGEVLPKRALQRGLSGKKSLKGQQKREFRDREFLTKKNSKRKKSKLEELCENSILG